MRYVPTDAPLTPAVAVRGAVHDLRVEAERRAWATRPLRDFSALTSSASARTAPVLAGAAASESASQDGVPDPLVGLLGQLRAVTARYVCALRSGGARPEQMLVQVKAFVREAMTAEGWTDPDATQAITAEVVRWSITAYYDG